MNEVCLEKKSSSEARLHRRAAGLYFIILLLTGLNSARSVEPSAEIYGFVSQAGTAKDSFSFAVWGDSQVAFYEKETEFGGEIYRQIAETVNPRLAEAIQATNRLDPEFVVTLGDNVHGEGQWEHYKVFVDLVRSVSAPVYLLMGNHDHARRVNGRETNPYGRREFGNFLWAQKELGRPQKVAYSFNAGRWHFVLFSQPGGNGWGVNACLDRHPELLAWLEEDLKKYRDRPTMFFTHHPPLPAGRLQMEQYGPNAAYRAQFVDLLTRYGNVQYAFFGHVHNTVSSIPLISWRYKGIAFVVMPNTAYFTRDYFYQESQRSSWGIGRVSIRGASCESIEFHTLAGEVVKVDPNDFPEYDDRDYGYLVPGGRLEAGPILTNGGFESPLCEGWLVNHLLAYEERPPIQTREIRTDHPAEGKKYLYLHCRAMHNQWYHKANFIISEVRQAVAASEGGRWPRLTLKYRLPSEQYRNPEVCNAFITVSGYGKEEAQVLFTLVYSLGRTFRVYGDWDPLVCLRTEPILDRWTGLELNVRSDYEQHFSNRGWDELGLETLVIRLGVLNHNYWKDGQPAEIAVGFDAVLWESAALQTPVSPGFGRSPD